MRFFALLRMTIVESISFIGYFEPFKSKDIANLFTETNSQMLCTGLEIHPLQIVSHRFSWRFAE